jgi:hypothetical protein
MGAILRHRRQGLAPLTPKIWGGESALKSFNFPKSRHQRPPELGRQRGLGVSPSGATGVDLGGKLIL